MHLEKIETHTRSIKFNGNQRVDPLVYRFYKSVEFLSYRVYVLSALSSEGNSTFR